MIDLSQLQATGYGLSILVVDDDVASAHALGSLLERIFQQVEVRGSVNEALKIYRENGNFDIIITDMWMPPSNGFELSKAIKEDNPDQKIIMVSGSQEEHELNMARQADIDAFLSKPLDRNEVYTTLFNIASQIQAAKATQ